MEYEPLMARFEDTALEIISERGERFVTVRDLAAGLGAKKRSVLKLIQDLARKKEVAEGVHFLCIPLESRGGTQNTMIVSYRGVLRIVMHLNSSRAARFRDWCEDVLYGIMTGTVPAGLQRGGMLETELKNIGTAAKDAMQKTCDLILSLRSNAGLVPAGAQPLKLLEGPTVTAMEWARKHYPHYLYRRMNSGGRFERYCAESHLVQFGHWPAHRPTRRLNAWEYPEHERKEFLEQCLLDFHVQVLVQRSLPRRSRQDRDSKGV
ncbi:MAG: BRO family protein [Candidatus Peregrinibacteria bacterium]